MQFVVISFLILNIFSHFVFFFLKRDPETVKASGLIKSGPTPVRVSAWTHKTCTHMTPFIMVCLSPSVLSVLFWSRTTYKRTTMFITVYLSPSIFCVLFWTSTTCRCTTIFITIWQRCFKDMACRPLTVSSCTQSSPWSYSNYRMWPTSVSKNFLHLNCTSSNVHQIKNACYLWKLIYNTNQQKQRTSVTFNFN
jgi:hypothetical protein